MATVFYFTGTGNSLSTARGIIQKINGHMIPITSSINKDMYSMEDVIGIVTPVYCMDLPNIVKKFLETYNFNNTSYIFGVVTCAGAEGIALRSMKDILEKRGLTFSYGNRVILPDNSIIFSTSNNKKQDMLSSQEGAIENICMDIMDKKINGNNFQKSAKDQILSKTLNIGLNKLYKIKNKTIDNKKCTHCGICSKVCPVSNIHDLNGFYTIGKDCENCFACAHWCPERAVSIGKYTPSSKTHYTHPKVTLKDIINKT